MGESLAVEWRSLSAIEKSAVCLAASAAALAIVFSLFDYPVIGHDSFLHLHWLREFSALREQGVIYPRWLPDGFQGLGSPAFYFYPPLTYFMASAVHSTLGGSPQNLYHAVQLSFGVIGTLTFYLVLRQRQSKRLLAIAAALAFSFAGYRFIDEFIRNSLGEHVALAFLPLLLVEWRRHIEGIALIAIALALLIFANIPTALLGGFILLFRCVECPKRTAEIVAGGLIATLATAIYWYPAYALSPLIRTEHLHDVLFSTSRYGFALLDIVGGGHDRLHVVVGATIMAGIVQAAIRWRRAPRSWLTWLLTFALVVQLPYVAVPLWKWFPALDFVQFSWRFEAVIWLVLLFDVAQHSTSAKWLVAGLLAGNLAISLPLVSQLIEHRTIPDEPIRYDAPEHATHWVPSWPWDFYHLAVRHQSDPDIMLSSAGRVSTIQKNAVAARYSIDLPTTEDAHLHMMYWPYWKAYVNGQSAALHEQGGLAYVPLPAGHSQLELRLEPAPSERTGAAMSVVGASLLVIVLGAASYTSLQKRANS